MFAISTNKQNYRAVNGKFTELVAVNYSDLDESMEWMEKLWDGSTNYLCCMFSSQLFFILTNSDIMIYCLLKVKVFV